jgi:hypothetical protein
MVYLTATLLLYIKPTSYVRALSKLECRNAAAQLAQARLTKRFQVRVH